MQIAKRKIRIQFKNIFQKKAALLPPRGEKKDRKLIRQPACVGTKSVRPAESVSRSYSISIRTNYIVEQIEI